MPRYRRRARPPESAAQRAAVSAMDCGSSLRSRGRALLAVPVDFAAAFGAGPAAPQLLLARRRLADHRQRRAATRAIGLELADAEAALRLGLLPGEGATGAEGDNDQDDEHDEV